MSRLSLSPQKLAALYYFFYFSAIGSLLPYLNLYYQAKGIETSRIGILAASMTAVSLFASPIWSALADVFHLHQRMLPALLIGTLPSIVLLGLSQHFETMLVTVILFAICLYPLPALADHAVLNLLGDKKHEYGRLRLWGSVGWSISALGTGRLIELVGSEMSFVLFPISILLCILVAVRLPAPRVIETEPYWVNLHRFFSQKRLVGFLVSIFCFGFALSTINNYLGLYVKALGGGEGLVGLLTAVGGMSELPIFMLSLLVLRKGSPRFLILLAFSALTIRCFAYGAMNSPEWAVLLQALHGPTFAGMYAGGVNHIHRLSPPGLGASAQAFFSATWVGVSGMVGAVVGSRLYDSIGPAHLFEVSGTVTLIGLTIFIMTEVLTNEPTAKAEEVLQPQAVETKTLR